MDTNQIFCILHETAAAAFLTCIPKDYLVDYEAEIRSRMSNGVASALVINTDPSNRPGEHWVALWISPTGRVYWFDSYGFPPSFYDEKLSDFCNRFSGKQIWFNSHMLQSTLTDVCGEYVVMFIYLNSIDMTPIQILSLFTTNRPYENDRLVIDMMKSLSLKYHLNRRCRLHCRPQGVYPMKFVLPSYTKSYTSILK
jgi:hypothetical protein